MPSDGMIESILSLENCFRCGGKVYRNTNETGSITTYCYLSYSDLKKDIDPGIHFNITIINKQYSSFIIKINEDVCIFILDYVNDKYFLWGLMEDQITYEASTIQEVYSKGLKIFENMKYLE